MQLRVRHVDAAVVCRPACRVVSPLTKLTRHKQLTPHNPPHATAASPKATPAIAAAAVTASLGPSMDVVTVPANVFLGAARVTAVYAILFFVLLIWQGMVKLRMAMVAQAKKEPFDRYNDKRMLPYDRTIGNFVEWSVPFVCLFWISMVVTNGATLKWGWVYVAARAMYPIMAVNKGIGTVGAKAPILLSTVPGYVALVQFIIPIVKMLLL